MISVHPGKKERFQWLALGLFIELGVLVLFKYVFVFGAGLQLTEANNLAKELEMNLLLPIGISFYTLQISSYLFDLYRKKIGPEYSFEDFLLYSMFFPQFLMGPIEKYENLGEQLKTLRKFSQKRFVQGIYLISLGFLKRFVVVNTLFPFVVATVNEGVTDDKYGAWLFFEACWAYIFIYFDFSSYMDLVRGSAKLLGIDLSLNFRSPLMAISPADLWRRWHMTLVNWIKDYFYYPVLLKTKNVWISIFLMFFVFSLFHDISWGWFYWGVYWSLVMVFSFWASRLVTRLGLNALFDSKIIVPIRVLVTFSLASLGTLFAPVKSPDQVLYLFSTIFVDGLGQSNLSSLSYNSLGILVGVVGFVTAQESLLKHEKKFESRLDLLIGFYFINFFLAISLGVFSNVPFQYINF